MGKKVDVETIKSTSILKEMPNYKCNGKCGIQDATGDKVKEASPKIAGCRNNLKTAVSQLDSHMNKMADAFKHLDDEIAQEVSQIGAGTTEGNKYDHLF